MANETGSKMKNLNGAELSDMLSPLSPNARAKMLKSRFASLIAKANPQMEIVNLHQTKQKQHDEQKTNAQSSQELINKRKRCEKVPLLQGRTSEVRRPAAAAADHKKVEEPWRSSLWKCKTLLPQREDHPRTSNPREEKKKTSRSSTLELQEEELKKIMSAQREKIDSERKAFRLKLVEVEGTVDIEDNFKVMRDFQELINNNPRGASNYQFTKRLL